jgi:signal transduction histidine kinase
VKICPEAFDKTTPAMIAKLENKNFFGLSFENYTGLFNSSNNLSSNLGDNNRTKNYHSGKRDGSKLTSIDFNKTTDIGAQEISLIFDELSIGMAVLKGEELKVESFNHTLKQVWLVLGLLDQNENFQNFTIPPGDYKNLLLQVFKTGETLEKNNVPIPVSVSGRQEKAFFKLVHKPYKESDGSISGVMVICNDITEKKLIQETLLSREERLIIELENLKTFNEKLLNAIKAKDEFISVISHDLRSPISNILTSSELILNNGDSLTECDNKEMVAIINKSSKKVLDQLEELVCRSKSNKDNLQFNPLEFNLHQAVKTSLQILESVAKHKSVIIKNLVEEDIVVYADPLLLKSIIQNLVSNAVKFSFEASSIIIRATCSENGFVEISIEDSGIGIPENFRKCLFSASGNYSTYGTCEEKGAGLGLKLVKDFVAKHGGEIRVESIPQRGTKFIFSIPSSKKSVL